VEDWIDRFAAELGESGVAPAEMGRLLKVSREVAHRVERRFAPLSTFVVGTYVGRRVAEGASREQALTEAVEAANRLLPEGEDAEGEDHGRA
jgi:hypothetical protein